MPPFYCQSPDNEENEIGIGFVVFVLKGKYILRHIMTGFDIYEDYDKKIILIKILSCYIYSY